VRVLLWHGYLLRGTGSNIYKANIVREWRAAGHDVLLMCQERDVEEFHFIDAHGDFSPGNDDYELSETGVSRAAGRATLVRPAIGDLLPVYVVDNYEGFKVKQYLDLSQDELATYVDRNVAALATAIERHRPEATLVGHEVMGPFIARKACARTGSRYAAQLHGSALEYVVKRDSTYLDYAVRGLGGAHTVIGGSEYMVREAGLVIPGWGDKACIVNPGCDVELFKPIDTRDPDAPVVGYVGKFIAQKGVHNLLAALGLTRSPGLRSVIVGYGEFDDTLRGLWTSARAGNAAAIQSLAEKDGVAMRALGEMAASGEIDDGYGRRASSIRLEFTGRLEHGPLARVLPTFDILVVPSIFAEAFGMVAAEAAACGVLPIVPDHSGIGEVGAILEAELGEPGLLMFDSTDPIVGISQAIDRVLAIDSQTRYEMGKTIATIAHERWAWPTVAAALLEAAVGDQHLNQS
jgi:glycosyltransferase involved in cell wall biosynthesis